MTLLQLDFYLFCIVALGGALMAALIGLKVRVPAVFSNGHGLLAMLALGILLAANLTSHVPNLAWWAFATLGAGFLGGGLLFRILFKDRAPLKLVAAHAFLGTTGLVLLYLSAF